jgi:3-oxoacyl-[acyl-carrier protein] reductase
MFDLSGKTALVTGASGGIGSAIAKALAAQGARVALSGTREAALQSVAGEIGGDTVILPCNLSDQEAVDALVPAAVEALGQLDILVNNAGITRDNLAMRMKDEEWSQVIQVNLESTFRLIRAALRPMMRAKAGRIISISSVVGGAGQAGQANYAASKAGMIGMSKAIAREVATRGITVNCVAPGFIQTAMTDELTDAQKESVMTNVPANRLGQPEDIAAAVVYLAADEGNYVTGETVHVNGGMTMN